MHLHYFTLKRQVDFIGKKVIGAEIIDSYTQVKNEWVIAFQSPDGNGGFLQLSTDAQLPYILLLDHQRRSSNSVEVMEEIINLRINNLELLPDDRIVVMDFDSLSLDHIQLRLHFFTHHTNFFIVDSEQVVINSFKGQRKHVGESYRIPASHPVDPLKLSLKEFSGLLLKQPQKKVHKTLKQMRHLKEPVAKEILFRSSVEQDTRNEDLLEKQIGTIFQQSQQLLKECQTAKPRIYFREENVPEIFAICQLSHLEDLQFREFQEINSALRFFCFRGVKQRALIQKKDRYSAIIENRINSLRRRLSKLQKHSDDADKKADYRKIGQLIVSQPQQVQQGMEQVKLVDYFEQHLPTITVKLDPKLSVQENAEAYFEKAKQSEEKIQHYQTRQEQLQAQIRSLERVKEQIAEIDSLKMIEQIEIELKERKVLQPDAEEAEKYYLPYKHVTFKSYDIWVGRSARDNDVMLSKHAHKEDFWLHVQGHSGSHVILRNPQRRDQMPSEVLHHAARLAVTFSKAKHASYVPVVYTKVKYVRKPRKSAPGAAVPSRVKTLFVDPLPTK